MIIIIINIINIINIIIIIIIINNNNNMPVIYSKLSECEYATLVDIQKTLYEKLFTHVESHASAVSPLESGEQRYIKAINNDMLAGVVRLSPLTSTSTGNGELEAETLMAAHYE